PIMRSYAFRGTTRLARAVGEPNGAVPVATGDAVDPALRRHRHRSGGLLLPAPAQPSLSLAGERDLPDDGHRPLRHGLREPFRGHRARRRGGLGAAHLHHAARPVVALGGPLLRRRAGLLRLSSQLASGPLLVGLSWGASLAQRADPRFGLSAGLDAGD